MRLIRCLTIIAVGLLGSACNSSEDGGAGSTSPTAPQYPFVAGYPTETASEALYDEMDLQRATQAYIWSVSLANSMGFRNGMADFGVTEQNRKLLVFENAALPQQSILTANSVTPYFWGLFDLAADGPMVVHMPAETVLGGFVDFWMRGMADFGAPGEDAGKGGDYLFLPPNYDDEVPDGYFVVHATSNLVWIFGKVNGAQYKGETAFDEVKKVLVYPLSEASNPPAEAGMVAVGEAAFSQDWPKDFEYWTWVAEALNRDVVRPIDKVMHEFLAPLGIVHGQSFAPDDRQRRILTKAAELGDKMVANMAFDNRAVPAYWPDKYWEGIIATTTWDFETDTRVELTARAAGWYQVCFNAHYLYELEEPVIGTGSAYLASYKDGSGAYLNGSNSYRLHIPAEVPVANFWSVTVYDTTLRAMIQNEQGLAGIGGPDKPIVNDDGSIDMYFGPKKPTASNSNWIQTNPDKGWFMYFRFYGPEQEYYDKSWQLNDVELLR